MKINKVKLHNFSSYEGNNEFDFEITDDGKTLYSLVEKTEQEKHHFLRQLRWHCMDHWHMDMWP